MSAVICTLCLIGACILLAFGVARLAAWLAHHRAAQRSSAVRQASLVAQARAELADREANDPDFDDDGAPALASYEWTEANEAAYQLCRARELVATTRGDLLAAASYAELADRVYSIAMLDQQDMGEGWS